MNVEDMILEGICGVCDRDPVACLNAGYCFYERMHDEINEEE